MAYELPTDLVRMAESGRLIPFAGAGLSAAVGLPTWRVMLEKASDVVESGPSFADLEKSCGGNLLQVAEYLFIGSGGHIGPLRQKLAECLVTSSIDIVQSACHVELFNVGAPQVYTTNYDDLIEKVYKSLGDGCEVVALPRYLALGGASTRTQVVKYHGDLRYEQTLVLTESSYYERMDFESPMDLKFRSDLLGRSVLFLGYSFSDINIRMIWHKLMQMMRDVPERDRPTSWIIRFDDDPIQEALNLAAGIQTIVLGPLPDAEDGGSPTQRLAAFLVELSIAVSRNGFNIVANHKQYVSFALLDGIDRPFDESRAVRLGRVALSRDALKNIQALANRVIPLSLADAVNLTFTRLATAVWVPSQSGVILSAAMNAISQGYLSMGVSSAVLRSLMRTTSRKALFARTDEYLRDHEESFPWRAVFGWPQPPSFPAYMLRLFRSEVAAHQRFPGDVDLLYIYDMALRLRDGLIVLTEPLNDEESAELIELINQVESLHDGLLAAYQPDPDSPPPKSLADQLEARLMDLDVLIEEDES